MIDQTKNSTEQKILDTDSPVDVANISTDELVEEIIKKIESVTKYIPDVSCVLSSAGIFTEPEYEMRIKFDHKSNKDHPSEYNEHSNELIGVTIFNNVGRITATKTCLIYYGKENVMSQNEDGITDLQNKKMKSETIAVYDGWEGLFSL